MKIAIIATFSRHIEPILSLLDVTEQLVWPPIPVQCDLLGVLKFFFGL